MKHVRFVLSALLLAAIVSACSPWVKIPPDEAIQNFLDFPMDQLYTESEANKGLVFEDRFKFYRIYHDVETADPSKREQTIIGKTHFTARPIQQYMYVIRIRITPRQEKWMRDAQIHRQDAIKARVRFAGIAPNGTLAFDLLEILDY